MVNGGRRGALARPTQGREHRMGSSRRGHQYDGRPGSGRPRHRLSFIICPAALVAAALAALVGVTGAAADGIVIAGNQNCAELMPGTTELRVDPPKDGTFTGPGGLSVTIDVRQLAADDPA